MLQSLWFDFDSTRTHYCILLFLARNLDYSARGLWTLQTLITVDSRPFILSNQVLCVLVIATEFADSCKQLSWSSQRE